MLDTSGFSAFLLDESITRYENDCVICERLPDGSVLVTGKPLKSVFIYEPLAADGE